MIPDKHDLRMFRHYAQLGSDGSVLATVEIAVGSEQPDTESGDFLEITSIHPYTAATLKTFVDASPIEAVKKRVQIGKLRG